MKRARLQAATVGGTPDEVEQAFYEALHHAQIEALMACWAEEDEMVCVAPDGACAIGAVNIRRMFEARLAAGGWQVQPAQVHKVDALACAVHHRLERVQRADTHELQSQWWHVTNVYHKTAQGWRMVAHHMSKAPEPSQLDHAAPAVLH